MCLSYISSLPEGPSHHSSQLFKIQIKSFFQKASNSRQTTANFFHGPPQTRTLAQCLPCARSWASCFPLIISLICTSTQQQVRGTKSSLWMERSKFREVKELAPRHPVYRAIRIRIQACGFPEPMLQTTTRINPVALGQSIL